MSFQETGLEIKKTFKTGALSIVKLFFNQRGNIN
jgi:hypothetical protein